MQQFSNFKYDKEELKQQLQGQAIGLLVENGIDPEVLDGKHHPCPKCGGKDRFRVLDTDNGVLFCNQCFHEKNGDIFAALQWWLSCQFDEAIQIVGQSLSYSPAPQKNHVQSDPENNSTPFIEQVEFLPHNQEKLDTWTKSKPPVTGDAAFAAGASLCLWPKKAPQRKQLECLAFPAYQKPNEPSGWILYRLNGDDFPEIKDGPCQRKTHLLRGSLDGWVFMGGHSSIESAHTIIKVEGIPDALSLYPYLPEGYVVVTNTHGAKSVKNCPVDIFRDRRTILIGDSDRPGIEGAENLAQKIAPVSSETRVFIPWEKITESGGKDLRDLMNENKLSGIDYQNTVDKLLLEAERVAPYTIRKQKPDNIHDPEDEFEEYDPFPYQYLPPILGDYVKEACRSIDCDPSFVALPLLAVIASLVGMSRVLSPKKDWRVPAILWTLVLGESGSAKTPAIRRATDLLYKLQAEAHKQYEKDRDLYDKQMKLYESQIKDDHHGTASSDLVESDKPEEPMQITLCVGDITTERLPLIYKNNPKGTLFIKDELSALFNNFNRYRGGKGSDEAIYLEGYNAGTVQVHRKGDLRDIYVPSAALSITGGIQPGVFKRIMKNTYRESGLLARFLLAYPPRKQKQFSDNEVSDQVVDQLEKLIEMLSKLQPAETSEGEYVPEVILLGSEAKSIYKRFHKSHNLEAVELEGDHAAAWSKLEEIPLRLSLIFQCVEDVMNGESSQPVSQEIMHNAIQLTEWFKKETLRVYELFDTQPARTETLEQKQHTRLMKLIRKGGGKISVRDAQRGMNFKSADETEKALQRLVDNQIADWIEIPTRKKGRPARGISFRRNDTMTIPQMASAFSRSVIDSPDKEEHQPEAPKDLESFMKYLDEDVPF